MYVSHQSLFIFHTEYTSVAYSPSQRLLYAIDCEKSGILVLKHGIPGASPKLIAICDACQNLSAKAKLKGRRGPRAGTPVEPQTAKGWRRAIGRRVRFDGFSGAEAKLPGKRSDA
jgi:hypothetical protein